MYRETSGLHEARLSKSQPCPPPRQIRLHTDFFPISPRRRCAIKEMTTPTYHLPPALNDATLPSEFHRLQREPLQTLIVEGGKERKRVNLHVRSLQTRLFVGPLWRMHRHFQPIHAAACLCFSSRRPDADRTIPPRALQRLSLPSPNFFYFSPSALFPNPNLQGTPGENVNQEKELGRV